MVDMMQNHRQRRPITTFAPRIIPWMYLTICLLSMGSHTIMNKFYDATFVGTVRAAQQHMFGRINCIATSKTHLIHVMRGGDQSNDDSSNDLDRNNVQPVNIEDGESVDSSLDAKIETELSQLSNETIPDVATGSKQYKDETNDDTDRSNGIPEDAVDHDHRTDNDDDAPIAGSESVGVMSPVKKSNAVGDPDGDDDDDDDDDSDDEEENEEEVYILDEDEEELSSSTATSTDTNTSDDIDATDIFSIDERDEDAVVERVQVEVEYTIEEEEDDKDEDEDVNVAAMSTTNTKPGTSSRSNHQRLKNMGGVGVRSFGQRFKNRNKRHHNHHDTTKSDLVESTSKMEQQFLEAWQSYIFYPPPPQPVTISNNSSFWQYLQQHHQAMDTDGKLRLDRRTLYSGILAEFSTSLYTANSKRSNRRKFLDTETSQALQAAVSLATQPIWRKSLQRPNAIRLYDIRNSENEPKNIIRESSSTTLAMQETITLGLATSFGAGMVILDDSILASVRQRLLRNGSTDNETKPAALIKHLLMLARNGKLLRTNTTVGASISDCMRSDLRSGMDDPFDERAMTSLEEMQRWENMTQYNLTENASNESYDSIPLVIFLRTQHSSALLRSKSAVETILSECNSTDSRNFLVLGNGVDASTTTLPQEGQTTQRSSQPQQGQGSSPWFGFTPHNQNASGQNDPEGSRRFNIFLARTVDPKGSPGLVGAIAPPEAGNLFPHMMAMQARQQLEQNSDEDSPMRAELERWAQMLQQQMQVNGGNSVPAPQFFNATITSTSSDGDESHEMKLPSAEQIQKALESAMAELLDGLAQMSEDGPASPSGQSPELQKAFAQVLRNENLRRGIAENLARAAPALSDPKCQGVLLSVFVPPPPDVFQSSATDKVPSESSKPLSGSMGSWFQKMLSHQEEADGKKEQTEENRKSARERRVRTMAAAAAVVAAQHGGKGDGSKNVNKSEKNLSKLEAVCRPIVVHTPADPVRAKSWDAWVRRERGAVIFRQNRRILKQHLEQRFLSLQEHTGTKGAGSSLRQMLSVRLLSNEMDDVIQRAIELEAAKSQLGQQSYNQTSRRDTHLDVDVTLSQLLVTESGLVATEDVINASTKKNETLGVQFIHPSTLESALSSVCRISPSPGGALSQTVGTVSHRSKDEIAALAQDKHERALLSQVVSPQDIGVTYDMIGGLTEVKELLRQSITYPLKFPHLYSEGIAREAVKGVLLFGPPGTGKTMLAKAVATEGGASFLSVDASSVENKWLGESEKNAKAVFTLARRLAPCVIFIDEVDSLLSSREGSSDDSAHGTLTSVKTTMMSEWDGLNSGTNGSGEAGSDRVVVIGSTNRPFDLDEAVLRRFPRRILVDLPDLETRTEILEVTLAENRLDSAVNLTQYAERLEGYTGSDLKEFCREAVVQISHEQAKLLDQGCYNEKEGTTEGLLQRLRPVTTDDLDKALKKLKRSVSENGRELARVWEWNDEYGEMKRSTKAAVPPLANMYL